jgi:hypothetical protein
MTKHFILHCLLNTCIFVLGFSLFLPLSKHCLSSVEVAWRVRNELLVSNQANAVLESWSGDPCLPKPWQGLACAPHNGSAIITSL